MDSIYFISTVCQYIGVKINRNDFKKKNPMYFKKQTKNHFIEFYFTANNEISFLYIDSNSNQFCISNFDNNGLIDDGRLFNISINCEIASTHRDIFECLDMLG